MERLLGAGGPGPAGRRRTGPCWSCSTAPGARISEAVGLDLGTWRPPTDWSGSTARGPRSGWSRLGGCAAAALGDWLGPGGRPPSARALAPARRRRGRLPERPGGRLSRQGAFGHRPGPRPGGGTGRPGEPARPAPLLRHPHAGPGGRHPGRPGAPGPRRRSPPPSSTRWSHPSTCGPPTSRPTHGPGPRRDARPRGVGWFSWHMMHPSPVGRPRRPGAPGLRARPPPIAARRPRVR